MSKVILIDGLNAIYRANVQFGSLPVGQISYTIVFNFFRSLKSTIEKFLPDKVFFCNEGSHNFRYDLFPNYKANRILKRGSASTSDNENFSRQRDIIIKLLKSLPISQARSDKYEADDVIASLALSLRDEETIVISSDSDYLQLLQWDIPNVKIYNPSIKGYLDKPAFHYLVWKALRGDKSDNVPKIMSDSKALKMVSDAKALEDFLISDENKALFNLNKSLIELKQIPDDEIEIVDGIKDLEFIESQFKMMGFKSMLTDNYWLKFKEVFNSL